MNSFYSALLDRLNTPLTVVTVTGVIMYRNRAFEKTFAQEADAWFRRGALTVGGEHGWLHGFFAAKDEYHAYEMEFNDRLYRIQKIMAEPLDVATVALSIEDVTKEAEIEQTKSDFMSMIVHDLRGPLSGIKATLDFVLTDEANRQSEPMHQDLLKEAEIEADRMMSLINELLDFSKIQSGRYVVESEPVALASVLKRAVSSLQSVAARYEVMLLSEHPLDLPPVSGSGEKLTQALINLISNALKFTPKNGLVTVAANVAPDAEHPERVVVTVTDTGVGIAENELFKVLERYEQAGSKSIRGDAGTGLGLYSVQAIVEGHGGRLDVASVQGYGTSMIVTLPIYHASVELPQAAESS